MKYSGESRGAFRARVLLAIVLMSTGCHRAPAEEEKPEPTLVKTGLVEEGTITEWLELQGRVSPPYDRDATIAPLVAGRITFLSARVGEMVLKGEVLARVETAVLDDEMKTAEAASRRAEADLVFKRGVAKRSRDLLAKGVASREEAESADAAAVAAESAQAEALSTVSTARRRRSWSELTAPFAGVVVRVDRRIGDYVDGTSATPVVEVAAVDGWEIVASATPASLKRLRSGQNAEVGGLAQADAKLGAAGPGLSATVSAIARAVDPTTGAGDVRLRPQSRPGNVALGTPVEVRISVTSHEKAVLVPRAALRMAADGTAEVVVVEGGVAHVRKIETGLTESDHVEVISGLKVGAHVVIEDPIGIAEGARVTEEKGTDSNVPRSEAPARKELPSPVK